MINDLYQQGLLDLAKAAHGAGTLPLPDAEASRDSPLCGDRVRMQVALEAGRIKILSHDVKGCVLCRAAASMIGLRAAGMNREDAKTQKEQVVALLTGNDTPPDWPELSLFLPVRPHRNRHSCVLLPFETLMEALDK